MSRPLLLSRWIFSTSTTGSAWFIGPSAALIRTSSTELIGSRPSPATHRSKQQVHRSVATLKQLSAQEEPWPEVTVASFPGKLISSDAIPSAEIVHIIQSIERVTPLVITNNTVVPLSLNELAPGVTGRVGIVDIPSFPTIDQDALDEWQGLICQEIDHILYSDDDSSMISQPILLSLRLHEDSSLEKKQLVTLIEEHVSGYGLADSVEMVHQESSVPNRGGYMPSLRYEVDGAMVADGIHEGSVWDTSSVLVFDDLVSPDLCARMLEVVLGSGAAWDDVTNGPDPGRWSEGGLMDLPDHGGEEASTNKEGGTLSYGLTDDGLEEICRDDPPPAALEEFEKLLTSVFPNFTVARLPEAVLGDEVTPLTANAPCFGQSFRDHIDGDPFFAPPSPWTDVYGRYANRAQGKPRFVSCLVYLNEEWNAEQWGAPTRFYDVATETAVDVSPRPGRVVIMDQDITHTVVPPLEAAGKRPRYSLVWKLILHPKWQHQDMRQLSPSHWGWPNASYIGSANR